MWAATATFLVVCCCVDSRARLGVIHRQVFPGGVGKPPVAAVLAPNAHHSSLGLYRLSPRTQAPGQRLLRALLLKMIHGPSYDKKPTRRNLEQQMLNEVPAKHHIMQSCPTHPAPGNGMECEAGRGYRS